MTLASQIYQESVNQFFQTKRKKCIIYVCKYVYKYVCMYYDDDDDDDFTLTGGHGMD